MPIQLMLMGDLLVVAEGDLGNREDHREIDYEVMRQLAALKAGTISEAEFVDWVCLRVRVAEALGDEATA